MTTVNAFDQKLERRPAEPPFFAIFSANSAFSRSNGAFRPTTWESESTRSRLESLRSDEERARSNEESARSYEEHARSYEESVRSHQESPCSYEERARSGPASGGGWSAAFARQRAAGDSDLSFLNLSSNEGR